MPSYIKEKKELIVSEFYCETCNRQFYISGEPIDWIICPLHFKKIFLNEDKLKIKLDDKRTS